jgi:hypothetical protein
MARSRRRKLGLGCGGLVLLLVVLFLALPTRRMIFRKHYAIVSIAQAPEYKDKARMDRVRAQASATPPFASPILYQPNGSLCGPTSLRSSGAKGAITRRSAATSPRRTSCSSSTSTPSTSRGS